MKKVNKLYHFTKEIGTLHNILEQGFKPSFAREVAVNVDVLIPMVSLSNVSLNEVGEDEMLFYGDYGISFSIEWGIKNGLNPVIYTHEKGKLQEATSAFLYNSLFLQKLEEYKDHFAKMKTAGKKFSQLIELANTPQPVVAILDYISEHYSGDLVSVISKYTKGIYDANWEILSLTKSYEVKDANGKEFTAYNDREWRKVYKNLGILFSETEEYEKWSKAKKPHFNELAERLTFSIDDIKVILLKSEDEVEPMKDFLCAKFGISKVEGLISTKKLLIGTRQQLLPHA